MIGGPGSTLWSARLVILIAFVDLFIQFPILAPYLRDLGAAPALVGAIVGVYSAANLVGNLFAGWILDRWGRQRPIATSLVLSAIALGGYAIARSPEQLFVARLIHGLATAALTPGAFALIADLSPPHRRGQAMGVSGTIIAFAAVAAPPIGGLIRDRWGTVAVFAGVAGLLIAGAIVVAVFVRDAGPRPRADPAAPVAAASPDRRRFSVAGLAAPYLAILALTVGLGALITHLPIALAVRGEPAARVGIAFTVYAIAAMATMATPINRISDRVGRRGPTVAGLLVISIGLIALAAIAGLTGAAIGMAIFGLGFGLLFPAVSAWVADTAGAQDRGRAFGVFYAVYSLGVALGSLASGVLGQAIGPESAAPFAVPAAITLAVAGAVRVVRPRPAGSSSSAA